MSIFSKLRRSFGLDADDEIFADDEVIATEEVAASGHPAVAAPVATQSPIPATKDQALSPQSIAAEMMTSVVELFNSFQPEFIARCLNTDTQKRLIAERMAPALLDKIAAIADAERGKIALAASTEREALDADLRHMRERNEELEKRRAEFKDEQLSAKRQKRALQERIHDLETQTQQLEAEKEQLELENRSMSNKLRVAGVTGAMPEATPAAPAVDTEAIARLEAEIASLRSDAEKKNRHIAELTEIVSQTEKIVEAAEKKDARIAELKARIKNGDQTAKDLDRALKENKELRTTLEANRYESALEISKLRNEIEEIKSSKPRRGRPRKQRRPEEEPEESTTKEDTKATPHISAIDELMDSSEWLVAPTREEVNMSMAEEPSDDFGYKAPARKPLPVDDPNQLTLF